jgi:hypothetical protein
MSDPASLAAERLADLEALRAEFAEFRASSREIEEMQEEELERAREVEAELEGKAAELARVRAALARAEVE